MSGENIPYHLRYNKYIDRQLFAELLFRVHRFFDIEKYKYIGFGGVFLEDMKMMHNKFNIKKLVSIEERGFIVTRQNINKPTRDILLYEGTSSEFLASFDSYVQDEPLIIWLDFASPAQLGSQLREIESLASKLKAGDIVRVTFNVNSNSLYDSIYIFNESTGLNEINRETRERVLEKKWTKLCSRLGAYLDVLEREFSHSDMTQENLPSVIYKLFEHALSRGSRGNSSNRIVNLMNNLYKDDKHPMLTCTSIILGRNTIDDFSTKFDVHAWEFSPKNGNYINIIDVPILSTAEKYKIDILLPVDAASIMADVGFVISNDPIDSEKLLNNYKKYQRFYPTYSRLAV